MKTILIVLIVILFFSFKSESQTTVLGSDGSILSVPTRVTIINHAPLYSIWDSVHNKVDQYLRYDTSQFVVINNVLRIKAKTPIPQADWTQELPAATGNQKVFTFRNLPPDKDYFQLFKNRTLCKQNEYSILGNSITYSTAQTKDQFTLILRIFYKDW